LAVRRVRNRSGVGQPRHNGSGRYSNRPLRCLEIVASLAEVERGGESLHSGRFVGTVELVRPIAGVVIVERPLTPRAHMTKLAAPPTAGTLTPCGTECRRARRFLLHLRQASEG